MGVDLQPSLEQLIQETPALWRGRGQGRVGSMSRPGEHTVDTGFETLNELLPNGGWPLRAVIEINVTSWGNGELQLLLPLMRRLTGAQSRVALIAPPHRPYAPALLQQNIDLPWLVVVDCDQKKDIWWSAEKLLRHPDCSLVLVWPPIPDPAQVRRLQLAADAGNGIGVIFRQGNPVDTPVGLRLKVSRHPEGIEAELAKSRYGWRQHGKIMIR